MGLGRAFALRLLENGAKVCISDVNEEVGKATTVELKQKFGDKFLHFVKCDVTKKEDLERLMDECEEYFKVTVDIFCNNAGVGTVVGWRKTMEVNINAVLEATYIVMEKMDKSKGGKGGLIVNTASIAGLFYSPVQSSTPLDAYYASKHAVVGLTKALSDEDVLRRTGIKFLCICPGVTNTAMVRGEGVSQSTIDNANGLMTPESVAVAYHSLVTTGDNGDVMVVLKDAPPLIFPDLNLQLVNFLAFCGKILGVKVLKARHQIAVAILLVAILHIMLNTLFRFLF